MPQNHPHKYAKTRNIFPLAKGEGRNILFPEKEEGRTIRFPGKGEGKNHPLPLGEGEGKGGGGQRISNSDPITGQAGWYDVRVRIYKAGADEAAETWPQFEPMPPAPGTGAARRTWQAFVAGKGAFPT